MNSTRSPYIRRMVTFEQSDYDIVRRTALEKGLGRKGFSAALRLIIREWHQRRWGSPSSPDFQKALRDVMNEYMPQPDP